MKIAIASQSLIHEREREREWEMVIIYCLVTTKRVSIWWLQGCLLGSRSSGAEDREQNPLIIRLWPGWWAFIPLPFRAPLQPIGELNKFLRSRKSEFKFVTNYKEMRDNEKRAIIVLFGSCVSSSSPFVVQHLKEAESTVAVVVRPSTREYLHT